MYNDFHMGNAAELCVREHGLTREEQDAFAVSSYEKALAAQEKGLFDAEIVPVEVPQRRGDALIVSVDEEPGRGRPDKLAKLRGAFEKDGTVTARMPVVSMMGLLASFWPMQTMRQSTIYPYWQNFSDGPARPRA